MVDEQVIIVSWLQRGCRAGKEVEGLTQSSRARQSMSGPGGLQRIEEHCSSSVVSINTNSTDHACYLVSCFALYYPSFLYTCFLG